MATTTPVEARPSRGPPNDAAAQHRLARKRPRAARARHSAGARRAGDPGSRLCLRRARAARRRGSDTARERPFEPSARLRSSRAMAPTVDPSRGALRIALGTGLLLCAGLLLVRASGPWPGDAIVWPAAVAAVGGLLIWSSPHSRPRARRGWAAHRSHELRSPRPPSSARAPSSVRALGRPEVSRGGLGVVLVLGAGFAFLWANGGVRPAGEAALAGLAVLIALALIFAPSWRRLARSLAAERSERIRSQVRADVGAHLHDSVLQTLALIQRNADDPRQVATLARQQERELRAWLTGRDPGRRGESVAAAHGCVADEVAACAGGAGEVVAVG